MLKRIQIPEGAYTKPHQLSEILSRELQKFGILFKYMDETQRFILEGVKGNKEVETITISSKLARMLGVADGTAQSYVLTDDARFRYACDLSGQYDVLYLYSDVVEYQNVGSSLAPLLRVLCPEKRSDHVGLTISERYIRPYYVPVCRSYIDSITIQIRTSTGDNFPFYSGSPIITYLHFRPVRHV